MNYPFAWLISLLLLLAAGCAPAIKPTDHPLARSSVFRNADLEVKAQAEEPVFRPPPVNKPITDPPKYTLSTPAPTPRLNIPTVSSDRPRYALVIGNSKYSSQALKNPVNDAGDISAVLKRLNFDVTLELDASHEKMEGAVRSFGKKR